MRARSFRDLSTVSLLPMRLRPSVLARPFVLVLPLAAAAWLVPGGAARAQGTPEWQQRVAYEMDIDVDAPAHRFTGRQRLTYQNNSPDTLRQVFYHLYFNAFQPTSMMAERNRHLPDPDPRVVPRIWNYTPDEIGYHRVSSLTMDGAPAPFRVDDTVMRVDLPRPIAPGTSAVFAMAFESQVPLQTRRSGWKSREGIDFSMSQWYPKMAQYDSRGWHAEPYIGREFFAPFGTFDVRITMPADYTMGSTGVLTNGAEIGKGYAPSREPLVTFRASEETRPASTRLTWRWRAENVHDFAWAADRDYTHDRILGPNGRTYHLLYQPNVAAGWEYQRRFVPAVIAVFEERFGPYRWPQFTVAQAGDGGMEYPMINFITGGRTAGSLVGVTAHEAAHEWFYGMLGSNEIRYAWMDEGFTEFATNEALATLFNQPADQNGAARQIAELRLRGLAEPISGHSDWYRTNRGYSTASYGGGNLIADLLGYTISDSVRDRGFRDYVRRYTFRHPQPADVERTFEQASGLSLDWLFEQLTHTTRRLDYAITDLTPKGNQTEIAFERIGEMVMPIDVRLTMQDGTTRMLTIPTTVMNGAKPVGPGWTVGRAWPWTSPRHTVTVDGRVARATLDPDQRLPEINRLNDTAGGGWWPVVTASRFWRAPVTNNPSAYGVGVRPLVQVARDYGAGVGVWARGGYWMQRHDATAALTLWPLVIASNGERPRRLANPFGIPVGVVADRAGLQSFTEGIDYTLRYATSPVRYGLQTRVGASFEKQQGVFENRLFASRTFGRWSALGRDRGTLTAELGHLRQPYRRVFDLYEEPLWPEKAHRVWAGLRYDAGRNDAKGERRIQIGGQVGASLRTITDPRERGRLLDPTYATDPTMAWAKATVSRPLGPLTLRARTMAMLGVQNLALDQRFVLGTGSMHGVWRSETARAVLGAAGERYTTSRTVCDFTGPDCRDIPGEGRTVPYVHALSAHGPTGYLTEGSGFPRIIGAARSVVTGNVEIETDVIHPRLPIRALAYSGLAVMPVTPDGFFGAVFATPDFTNGESYFADAGVGLRLALVDLPWLRRFTTTSDALSGARLTARLPFYVRDPRDEGDRKEIKFRTLFGVELPF